MEDVGYEVEMMDGPNGPEPRICTLTDGRKVPLERADRGQIMPCYDRATGRITGAYWGACPTGKGPFEPTDWDANGFPWGWELHNQPLSGGRSGRRQRLDPRRRLFALVLDPPPS